MSFTNWLRNLRSFIAPAQGERLRRSSERADNPRQVTALHFEVLEDRHLLSTLSVLNNLDSGPGSLRAEIAAARNGDTIRLRTRPGRTRPSL